MEHTAKDILKNLSPRAISAAILMLYILTPKCTSNTDQPTKIIHTVKTPVQKINLDDIDTQIKSAHQTIDSLRYILNQSDEQIIKSNPVYTHKSKALEQIDSLHKLNYSLMLSAYNAARKQSALRTPKKNTKIFEEFSDIPAVQNAHKKFKQNIKKIANLQQTVSAFDKNKNSVAHNTRYATVTEIQTYQKQIDSLLNIKNQRIQERLK